MALSGSVTAGYWYSSAGLSRGYKLSWSAVQSIANNTSDISWTLATDGTYPYAVAERTLYVVLAGNVLVNKTDRVMREAGTVASGSFTVFHASDGTYGFTGSIQAAVYESSVNCTGSATFALDQIPRQANITSADSVTDEENPHFTFSNPGGFDLNAELEINPTNAHLFRRSIPNTGSYTFALTDSERETLRSYLTDANSGTLRYLLYSDNESWVSYVDRTVMVVNAQPTLEGSAADSNPATVALTGDENVFIRYMSNANVSMTAEAKKGASITSRRVKCGNSYVNTNQGTIQAVESGEFVFSVADSRGNITSETVKKTLIEYVKPTCVLNAGAPNAGGEMVFAINGICFVGSFGAAENTTQAHYRYKEANGEYTDWIAVETDAAEGTYSANVSLTDLDYTKQYTFQAKVEDSLMAVESVERTVRTVPVFDWGENSFNFNVPVTIQGTDVMGAIGGKQELLGFTPVQQGGGSGQNANKVYIGWSGARLKAQVDVTDIGNIVFDGDVCEYGANSNGCYYKFPDGTLICTKAVSVSGYACTSSWGALYDGPAVSLGNWPLAFAAMPAVNVVWVSSAGGILEGVVNATSDYAGDTWVARGTASTLDGAIHVTGIGRWK